MYAKEAVPSLSVYESAYLYCPDPSVLVTSRLNVELGSSLAVDTLASLTQKHHYYFPTLLDAQESVQDIQVKPIRMPKTRYSPRLRE